LHSALLSSSASKILVSNLFQKASKISVEAKVGRSPLLEIKLAPSFALEPLSDSFAAGWRDSSSSASRTTLRLL